MTNQGLCLEAFWHLFCPVSAIGFQSTAWKKGERGCLGIIIVDGAWKGSSSAILKYSGGWVILSRSKIKNAYPLKGLWSSSTSKYRGFKRGFVQIQSLRLQCRRGQPSNLIIHGPIASLSILVECYQLPRSSWSRERWSVEDDRGDVKAHNKPFSRIRPEARQYLIISIQSRKKKNLPSFSNLS